MVYFDPEPINTVCFVFRVLIVTIPEQISAVVSTLAFYANWPVEPALEKIVDKKIILFIILKGARNMLSRTAQ